MTYRLVICMFAFLFLLHSTSAKIIEINWIIPENEDSYYVDEQASPGDTIVFYYQRNGNTDVYIHPSGNCTRDGSILIAPKGFGSGDYTFVDSEINTTVFFTSQAPSHCALGQFINVNVVEAPDTPAPSSVPTIATSDTPSSVPTTTASDVPSNAPIESPSSSPTAEPTSIFVLASEKGSYDSLLGAVEQAGLLPTLTAVQGPLTVFGPNDDAFAVATDVLAGLSQTDVVALLGGHVVLGNYTAAELIANGCTELNTVSGTQISVTADDGGIVVNGISTVVDGNLIADDGVLHGIDAVIQPGSFVSCPTPEPSSSFIPSDMPSLVPSQVPTISTMATSDSPVADPPTQSPIASAPTFPPKKTQRPTFVAQEPSPEAPSPAVPQSSASSHGMLTGSLIAVAVSLMA